MKIRADLIRLRNEANRIDFKLLLDVDRLESLCCRGREVHIWNFIVFIFSENLIAKKSEKYPRKLMCSISISYIKHIN